VAWRGTVVVALGAAIAQQLAADVQSIAFRLSSFGCGFGASTTTRVSTAGVPRWFGVSVAGPIVRVTAGVAALCTSATPKKSPIATASTLVPEGKLVVPGELTQPQPASLSVPLPASPSSSSPHASSEPVTVRASAAVLLKTACFTLAPEGKFTCTGNGLGVVVPSPISPCVLSPQARSAPVEVTARLESKP